jgi:hypothetical protein
LSDVKEVPARGFTMVSFNRDLHPRAGLREIIAAKA